MLTTHPAEGRARLADNLLPTADGGLETRPGAVQLLEGDVEDLAVWGERLVVQRAGRIEVAVGEVVTDLAQAGRFLRATAFQALTGEAQREDRLYIADGMRPLWYVARRAGAYASETVVNTLLDPSGMPYPLPAPPIAVATWRNRLWVSDGSNRVAHCQNDAPAEWDPLWVVEFQGPLADRVTALEPHGALLAVGTLRAYWAVTGTSHLNWQWDTLSAETGVASAHGLRSAGGVLYAATRAGLLRAGESAPLSDDVREVFEAAPADARLAVDARARLLYCYAAGRLLVRHLDSGRWGEVAAPGARGVFVLGGAVGWYGRDGVWVLRGHDRPDQRRTGELVPFTATLETWHELPNPSRAGGRALLNRERLTLRGSRHAGATYTVTADDALTFSAALTLSDAASDTWDADTAPADGSGEAWPPPPVLRELTPRLAGARFVHRIEGQGHFEVVAHAPEYRYRRPKP